MKAKLIDEAGKRYGDWEVLQQSGAKTPAGSAMWLCRCSCGAERDVAGTNLRNGQSTSCGCKAGKKSSGLAPLKHLYKAICFGAKGRGLEMAIGFEEFVVLSTLPCHYCGEEPYDRRRAFSRKSYNRGVEFDEVLVSNSLDRVDSDQGYTPDNVVPCCGMCNRMKSDFTLAEFLERVELIQANMQGDKQ